jgi:hypothetical protein
MHCDYTHSALMTMRCDAELQGAASIEIAAACYLTVSTKGVQAHCTTLYWHGGMLGAGFGGIS